MTAPSAGQIVSRAANSLRDTDNNINDFSVSNCAGSIVFDGGPSGSGTLWSNPVNWRDTTTNADRLPTGGQDPIRRILFNSGGSAKTFLQLIKEKKPSAERADLRFGLGPDNQVFLLNKQDGTIRQIVR